jgi:hypothetical protein
MPAEKIYPLEIECLICKSTKGSSEIFMSDSGFFIIKFTCDSCVQKSTHAFTYQQLLEIALLQRITSDRTLVD